MPLNTSRKKIAIISGFTGYVGSCIAQKLSEDGILIVGLYRKSSKLKAENIKASLVGEGHVLYVCDLEEKENLESIIKDIETTIGVPSLCIHAAWSKPARKSIISSSKEELIAHLEENSISSFNFLMVCGRYLKSKKEGVLIGITTSGVLIPSDTKGLGGYIVAKYALQGMLTVLKEELHPYGVRVYSIAPSFMDGGMNQDIPQAFIDMLKAKNNNAPLASAEDVADKVRYVCSLDSLTESALTFLVTSKSSS
jgi:3-oxoacyl-[acyl-carrier protein] reductase